MTVIHLVPGAPPQVNGVADFALAVARSLRRDHCVDSSFVVCNPAWEGAGRLDGFSALPLRSRQRADLCGGLQRAVEAARPPASVLLQLSPYGFSAIGAPFWLLRGLADWKCAAVRTPSLLTFFHELYVTSPPWRRGFWLSPLQRFCAREILRQSDVALTNTERYAERLAQWDRGKPGTIAALPVVSGIGEPAEVVPLERRTRQLVVWGSAQARRGIYGAHARALEGAIHAANVDRILDVGAPCLEAPAAIGPAVLRRMGVMPPDELSALLSNSVLGVMAYNPNYLGKSSMYAAFCAHGVPVLVIGTHALEPRLWDGVRPENHYLTPATVNADGALTRIDMQRVAAQARAWYGEHDAAAHARTLASHLLRAE